MHVIYRIHNHANGKVYIGKSEKNADERFAEHLKESSTDSQRRLCQAIRKHGEDVFSVFEIEHVDDQLASERERFWIAHYRSKDYALGYNMTDGGEGAPGRFFTDQTRRKISEKVKAHISTLTDEERSAMTKDANTAKRGCKEKPSATKKIAQQARWDNASEEQRKDHGVKSAAGVAPENRHKQIQGMISAFSPVRQPGYKQEQAICPHCGKIGGKQALKRYHFANCKHQ